MENFLGINPTDTYASAGKLPLPLGTEARKQKKVYRMVLADEDIDAGDFVQIGLDDNEAIQLVTASAAVYALVGVAETAIADESYGWVTVYGVVADANVGTGAAANDVLYTTGTAGRADDSGGSIVLGATPLETAAANAADVHLAHPIIAPAEFTA